ncbi:sigma-70 family RNA polymerase sigma factor [Candidatus Poribacteria bacterium]|nr:sigma-70 family RNA polymerase sigma factor [Candidatus Poribacteria bacterium]MYK20957.1 sigma-70 family RNA polymerase sigma factor [Candidatus Poribacteria bacterium]
MGSCHRNPKQNLSMKATRTHLGKYQKSVHALAWRKIGDFHFAEEITQDTFLQAYKKLATLRNPKSMPMARNTLSTELS